MASDSTALGFVDFALSQQVLKFGEFTLKSGRLSPYFFNAGLFSSGEALAKLGEFYADAIAASGIEFDCIFGPAYKGSPRYGGGEFWAVSVGGRGGGRSPRPEDLRRRGAAPIGICPVMVHWRGAFGRHRILLLSPCGFCRGYDFGLIHSPPACRVARALHERAERAP